MVSVPRAGPGETSTDLGHGIGLGVVSGHLYFWGVTPLLSPFPWLPSARTPDLQKLKSSPGKLSHAGQVKGASPVFTLSLVLPLSTHMPKHGFWVPFSSSTPQGSHPVAVSVSSGLLQEPHS